MQKRVFGKKFSRSRKAKEALFRGLVRAMVLSGKMTTTKAKAKAVQGILEKFVTWAREGSFTARRRVLRELANDRETVGALFDKVAPVFKEKPRGYTRIIPLPKRLGDAAEMARIEWTEQVQEKQSTPKAVIQSKKNKEEKAESEKGKQKS